MKKSIRFLTAVLPVMLMLSGCGLQDKNENIKAGMTAIEALDYDGALESFAAAREAGEDESLLVRGEGIAYMGKTEYEAAVNSFVTALSLSDGRVGSMDYDMNYYLATAYYKQGMAEEVLGVYNAIIAMKPEEREAYYLRGVIETEKGCYVAKVTSLLDRTATDSKKSQIVQERQTKLYDDTVKKWRKKADIKVHKGVWKKVSFQKVSVKMKTETQTPYTDQVQTDDQAQTDN